MKRRNFLKYIGIGGPAIAVMGLSARAAAATDNLAINLKHANIQVFEFAAWAAETRPSTINDAGRALQMAITKSKGYRS